MTFFQATRPINKKRGGVLVMFSTVLILVTALIFSGEAFAASSSNQGQDFNELRLIEFKPSPKAPDFALKDLTGKVLRLESFQKTPLVLYFWATW